MGFPKEDRTVFISHIAARLERKLVPLRYQEISETSWFVDDKGDAIDDREPLFLPNQLHLAVKFLQSYWRSNTPFLGDDESESDESDLDAESREPPPPSTVSALGKNTYDSDDDFDKLPTNMSKPTRKVYGIAAPSSPASPTGNESLEGSEDFDANKHTAAVDPKSMKLDDRAPQSLSCKSQRNTGLTASVWHQRNSPRYEWSICLSILLYFNHTPFLDHCQLDTTTNTCTSL